MENTEKSHDLTPEQMIELAKEYANSIFEKYSTQKQKLADEISNLYAKINDSKEKEKTITDWSERNELMKARMEYFPLIKKNEKAISNIDNVLKAIASGGTVVSIIDELGNKHEEIADFRKVTTEYISFDEETILTNEIPNYIPQIDEAAFKRRGGALDAIRIEKDSYLLSFGSFVYPEIQDNHYVVVTLDQLVLIDLYYKTKIKAELKAEADRKTQKNIDFYKNLSLEKRQKHFSQPGYYRTLPAKVKKQFTEEEWNSLNLEEKEKHYLPIKKYGPKRLKFKLATDSMYSSFHIMYNVFVDKTKLRRNKSGQTVEIFSTQGGGYGHEKVFEYWHQFAEMMKYKAKDIDFQRQELSETYQKALETAYGDSNTSDVLIGTYGVMVKRQNGSQINPSETNEISNALDKINSVFGSFEPKFLENNIKISHTGKVLVFASKALGRYAGMKNAILVSNKYGDLIFSTVLAHEIAHFIDNKLGEKQGKRWATDDFESTAGKIAFNFRNSMFKNKNEQSDYINATKECFARAFEQYFAVEFYGPEVEIVYSDHPLVAPRNVFLQDEYATKEKYYSTIKPLIEEFINENSEFFGKKISSENQEIKDTIDGLKVMLDVVNESEKEEINATISGLEILLLN